MAKSKKVRAHHIARKLGISFKELQPHAETFGVTFRSAQNSIAKPQADDLIKKVRKALATAVSTEPINTKEDAPEVVVAETNSKEAVATETVGQKREVAAPIVEAQDALETPAQDTTENDESPIADVQCAFTHARTLPGDKLFVIGDLPELGEWDPGRAVELDPREWPTWKATLQLPRGASFEYKLLVKNQSGIFWEEGGNRTCTVPKETPQCQLDGTFR